MQGISSELRSLCCRTRRTAHLSSPTEAPLEAFDPHGLAPCMYVFLQFMVTHLLQLYVQRAHVCSAVM